MPLPESLSLAALRALEKNPDLTQRQLARELGVSLGRTNYCVQALVSKGWVKAGNFRRSDNKRAYLYKLTPAGLTEKARLATRFLRAKEQEYSELVNEIEQLRAEVAASKGFGDGGIE
ncbi:MarR family EPS-associated transcriptional regulator [Sediminicurvatus halobius]|uniref:MarR family EPS-associated transcriptional regulator n=1 Tax=Sediminicurvatus halobius TaxID=2182432 RepID=A0A2U2N1J2_9GAMM|nr:MarR family EPS-associated transcriptional regulator [Spiribacter halobius]PWG62952.1 MarR family EPS-associated transcriptional regulator [Spiribacter halobius]UEX77465.1 MarR family EPS-associated transcriptional regulator [Spiribacter halobius]